MNQAGHSVKNTAKNVSLIVLVLLLGVLCAANWLAGMNIDQMPADNLLRRAYDHVFGGAVGVRAALVRRGGSRAAQARADHGRTALRRAVQPDRHRRRLGSGPSAVGGELLSDGELEQAEEAELVAALRAGGLRAAALSRRDPAERCSRLDGRLLAERPGG